MFTTNSRLFQLTLIGMFALLLSGCQQSPQQMPQQPRINRIDATHINGRLYMVAIGDSSGGMGAPVQMTLVKPDCTHNQMIADSIVFTR